MSKIERPRIFVPRRKSKWVHEIGDSKTRRLASFPWKGTRFETDSVSGSCINTSAAAKEATAEETP
jgi:hypothetical protein